MHRKFTVGHNWKTNIWNQTLSIALSGKKAFGGKEHDILQKTLLYLMVFCKGFEKEKNLEMILRLLFVA
jgi:hypothetical protein